MAAAAAAANPLDLVDRKAVGEGISSYHSIHNEMQLFSAQVANGHNAVLMLILLSNVTIPNPSDVNFCVIFLAQRNPKTVEYTTASTVLS